MEILAYHPLFAHGPGATTQTKVVSYAITGGLGYLGYTRGGVWWIPLAAFLLAPVPLLTML